MRLETAQKLGFCYKEDGLTIFLGPIEEIIRALIFDSIWEKKEEEIDVCRKLCLFFYTRTWYGSTVVPLDAAVPAI